MHFKNEIKISLHVNELQENTTKELSQLFYIKIMMKNDFFFIWNAESRRAWRTNIESLCQTPINDLMFKLSLFQLTNYLLTARTVAKRSDRKTFQIEWKK